jgi:Cu2+-exporting ATPase/Cu+-exporting ATPase
MTPTGDSSPVACACHDAGAAPVAWWRIGAGFLIAANAMTLSLALNTSQVTASEARVVHALLFVLAIASLSVLGWPLARNVARAVGRRRISIEAMFVSGIVGAMTGSLIAAVTGTGDSYFEIVPILLVVCSFGQQLVGRVQDRALRAALEWAPELGRCLVLDEAGTLHEIPVSQLERGQRVMVPPGAMVAADGVVESGEAFVREAEITGEPFVVVKRLGMPVWAGTHCVDAPLVVRATTDGCSRRIDRILGAVEAARMRPAPLQTQADRFVAWLLPAVLAVAALTMAGWLAAAGWRVGLYNAMAVLLVACPCALGLATPLAVWVAIARLASRGLVVRGGGSIEAMAAADAAVFDKTGTITEPRTRLVDIVTTPMAEPERLQLLGLVATVQRATQHPVAAAFDDLQEPTANAWSVAAVTTIPGVGVRASVVSSVAPGRRSTLEIGTADRLVSRDQLAQWRAVRTGLRAPPGVREIAVVLDGVAVAAAAVDERLRESWPEALAMLRSMGIATLILTGDSSSRAGRAGADVTVADLSPEDKLDRVAELAADGRHVLFLGDGVNDAAAMAASHVGIGVAAGAALATEVADVVWHGSDLRAIPWAVETSRRAVATIRSNLGIAVAYNLAGITLAVAGILHPVAAALLMTASSLIVTWRAIRPLHQDQVESQHRAASPIQQHLDAVNP